MAAPAVDGHDAVVEVGLEQAHVPHLGLRADARDEVAALGHHRDRAQVRMVFAQIGRRAAGRARGAQAADQIVDAGIAQILVDLAAGAVIMRLDILLVGVLRRMMVRAGMSGHRRLDHRVHVVGGGRVRAFGQARQFLDLGAEQLQQLAYLVHLDAVGDRAQPHPAHGAQDAQRLGGIAARGLDEGLPARGDIVELVADHAPRDPILDRAERVGGLQFRVELHVGQAVRRRVQAQQGGVADQLGDVVVAHQAVPSVSAVTGS